MNYNTHTQPLPVCSSPRIIYRDDNFLSLPEITRYQNLLKNNNWSLSDGNTLDNLSYISQSLYQHYNWAGDWDSPRWLDSTPPDWEELYHKIAEHLPPHFVHWVDVKITGAYQGGTPMHRDKDPWNPGGDATRFSRAITILCNLNTIWETGWGGGVLLYETNEQGFNTVNQTIPIIPGQLLIIENCVHSIELITEPTRNRISFILHVLEYSHYDSI